MDSVRSTLLDKVAESQDQMAQLEAPTGDRGEISFGKRIGEGRLEALPWAALCVEDSARR